MEETGETEDEHLAERSVGEKNDWLPGKSHDIDDILSLERIVHLDIILHPTEPHTQRTMTMTRTTTTTTTTTTTINPFSNQLSPAQQSTPVRHLPSNAMPPTTHDVIALISGGKDSFLALLHCLAQNHNVVALANLHPPIQSSSPSPSSPADPSTNSTADTAPDANSYMYQTVGHTLIPLYARALSIPLYRGEILGAAVNSQRDYYPGSSSSPPPTSHLVHPHQEQAEPADETESLIPLLRRIQCAHPSATALVSGAILSNYQRTRIESVALRLRLVPLAPLWQYPFLPTPAPRSAGLLEDVAAVGLEARIVKVASGGLDEGFLWGDLRDTAVRMRLGRGVGRFGGSVLGEGGEYETLVMDGPAEVFKGRVDLDEVERVVRRGEGGEAYLAFTGGRVVQKEGPKKKKKKKKKKKPVEGDSSNSGEKEVEWRRTLRVPGLWDERFQALVGKIQEPVLLPGRTTSPCPPPCVDDAQIIEYHPPPRAPLPQPLLFTIPQPHTTYTRCTLTISNLSFPFLFSSSSSSSAIHQTRRIVSHLRGLLHTHHRSPSDILFTTLLLRDMSHFPLINATYSDLFTPSSSSSSSFSSSPSSSLSPTFTPSLLLPLPPARVTVACGDLLPPGVEVSMRVVIARAGAVGLKDGLHVQSRSWWAPANIGPYSQAVAVPFSSPRRDGKGGQGKEAEVVYMAGQIPLVPASMEVFGYGEEEEGGEEAQICLALQHAWRVGAAMRVQWWMGAIAFLAPPPSPSPGKNAHDTESENLSVDTRARMTWSAWTTMHDPTFFSSANAPTDDEEEVDVWDRKYGRGGGQGWEGTGEEEFALPDFGVVSGDEGGWEGGFFAVEVHGLPRGCGVEWQVLGVRNVESVFMETWMGGEGLRARTCTVQGLGSVSYISVPLGCSAGRVEREVCALVREMRRRAGGEHEGLDMTVYTAEGLEWGGDGGEKEGADDEESGKALANAHVIPCRAVWGQEGQRLKAGVVVQIDM